MKDVVGIVHEDSVEEPVGRLFDVRESCILNHRIGKARTTDNHYL